MTQRRAHTWWDADGHQRVVTVDLQQQWGRWVNSVLVHGPNPRAPEGPRMQDTGDPPQAGCKFCDEGCALCRPDGAR